MANPNPTPLTSEARKKGTEKLLTISPGVQRRRLSDKLLFDLAVENAYKLFEELGKIAFSTPEEMAILGIDGKDKVTALYKFIDKLIISGKYSDYMENQKAQSSISVEDILKECAEEQIDTKEAIKFITLAKRIQEKKEAQQSSSDSLEDNE
jgi:hypothetical protein